MLDVDFLSKEEAARKLGISLSTFDRRRKQLGLQPVPGVLEKPLRFAAADVAAIAAGKTLSRRAPTRGPGTLLSLSALQRTRAGELGSRPGAHSNGKAKR